MAGLSEVARGHGGLRSGIGGQGRRPFFEMRPSKVLPARGASRSFTLDKLLPSKFRRDFVILVGLRVVTFDRSALLPNRRLLEPGNEEGVGRFLGGARGGVPSITICFYALLGHTGPCTKCQRAP